MSQIFRYWVLGMVLGSAISVFAKDHIHGLFRENEGFGVLMAATIGVPLYACGGGTIPLLQAWLLDGMSMGSAAAFMITGPATKITNLGAVKIVLGAKRFALYLAFTILFALALCLLVGCADQGGQFRHRQCTLRKQPPGLMTTAISPEGLMAGFGGAIKNISIGLGSSEGKCWIHSGGTSRTSPWGGDQTAFTESMAEAGKSVSDYLGNGERIVYVNRIKSRNGLHTLWPRVNGCRRSRHILEHNLGESCNRPWETAETSPRAGFLQRHGVPVGVGRLGQLDKVPGTLPHIVPVIAKDALHALRAVKGNPDKLPVVVVGKARGENDPLPGGHVGHSGLMVGTVEDPDPA